MGRYLLGVHYTSNDKRRFHHGPHAEVETLFFVRECTKTDTPSVSRFQRYFGKDLHEHIHVCKCTRPVVLGVGHGLVRDAPDCPPCVEDVVAHSPRVAQWSSPARCQWKKIVIRGCIHHCGTSSPIPHWHRKYLMSRFVSLRAAAILMKRSGLFASAESESTISVLDVA